MLRDYALSDDAPLELRESPIFWIGQGSAETNGRFLRELYGRTSDPKLREKVIFSVAQQGGRENARWLLDRALDTNEPVQVRKAEIFWAGQTGVAADRPKWVATARHAKERGVLARALQPGRGVPRTGARFPARSRARAAIEGRDGRPAGRRTSAGEVP